MLRKPPFGKIWDFETLDGYIYQKFIQVLKMYNVLPLEEHDSSCDVYACRFCCVERERIQIEYVFRKTAGLKSAYLFDLDKYYNRCIFYKGEPYAIY